MKKSNINKLIKKGFCFILSAALFFLIPPVKYADAKNQPEEASSEYEEETEEIMEEAEEITQEQNEEKADAPKKKPTKAPAKPTKVPVKPTTSAAVSKPTATVTPVPTVKETGSDGNKILKSNYNLERYGLLHLPIESNNARYQYLLGTNEVFYTFDYPPSGYLNEAEAAKKMITLTVPIWKMTESGGKYQSKYDITVNKKLAANVKAIFDDIFALDIKFPIKVLKGYSYRSVGGVGLSNSTLMSMHSFGAAIDINPDDFDNDYFLGAGNDLRDKTNPYCIPDEVIGIFEKHGWFWGGNFSICSDTMHFQYPGLEYLTYQDNSPFREVRVSEEFILKGEDIRSLQNRLKELGYNVNIDGVYGKAAESAVIKFQKKYNLPATGIVDYITWEKLINLTHYLPHVF